jgi:hypothetical protein
MELRIGNIWKFKTQLMELSTSLAKYIISEIKRAFS